MSSPTHASAPEPVISAEGLCKTYRIYKGQDRGWLKSIAMPHRRERFYDEHEALVDVDLRIPPGEIVGIMGRNGSGKSTLLRLLAGISLPTRGSVAVRGNVRCLLSTGINFNPRFTGRQNILYGSAAMGIPVELARQRMDEIIEFSELGAAIDRPSLFYSTGMATKLSFAVAFQETPEVLLLDEALSAGDAFFHHKCDQRIKEIVSSGSTVVMATHSFSAVEDLCTYAVLLEEGRLIADGDPGAVVEHYRDMMAEAEATRAKQLADESALAPPSGLPVGDGRGRTRVELLDARLYDSAGAPCDSFGHGDPLELRLRLRGHGDLPLLRFTLDVLSEDFGLRVANLGTEHLSAATQDLSIFPLELHGEHELTVRIPRNPFGSGLYSWSLSVRPFDTAGSTTEYLRKSRIAPFRSVSFPGHDLGRLRRMLTEPEVTFSLESCNDAAEAASRHAVS